MISVSEISTWHYIHGRVIIVYSGSEWLYLYILLYCAYDPEVYQGLARCYSQSPEWQSPFLCRVTAQYGGYPPSHLTSDYARQLLRIVFAALLVRADGADGADTRNIDNLYSRVMSETCQDDPSIIGEWTPWLRLTVTLVSDLLTKNKNHELSALFSDISALSSRCIRCNNLNELTDANDAHRMATITYYLWNHTMKRKLGLELGTGQLRPRGTPATLILLRVIYQCRSVDT
jgi:hypothetical protein